MTTLPVPSFAFCILNLQLSKENCKRALLSLLEEHTSYFIGSVFVQHEGKNLLLQLSFRTSSILATVDENVVLPGVGVEVAVHRYSALLQESPYHQLRVPNGRVGVPHDRAVLPIQVFRRQGTSVVSDYHSIGVQHRNYFKNELVTQFFGHSTIAG